MYDRPKVRNPSPPDGPLASGLRLAASVAIAAAFLAAPGCGGEPQISGENRDLIVSLATAVSTREDQWLDKNAKAVEDRHAAGKCSDAEYKTFQDIIAAARAGRWDEAQTAVYALRDAQEPTSEDLKNLSERKLDHQPRTLGPKGRSPRKS